MPNFYELLNVKSTASQEELKRNYKQLILQCHPDKLQQHGKHEEHKSSTTTITSEEKEESTDPNMTKKRKKFLAINEAWNTLKDPIKRKLYDAQLLQTKFQMHNNVYDTITCNEMRHEVWLLQDDDNDDDYDGNDDDNDVSDKEEKESKKYNENKAKTSLSIDGTTESEVLENYVDDNVRENHVTAVVDDEDNKEITTTTTRRRRVYYVYDCRCGGQYALDESAYEALREGDNNKHKDVDNKHSLCRNNKSNSSSSSTSSNTKSHHHHQQQQQQQKQQQPEEDNNELKANQKEEKLHRNQQQQQQKRTSVIMSVDDGKVISAAAAAAAASTHDAYGDGDGDGYDGADGDDCIAKQNQARNEVNRGVVDVDDDGVEGEVDLDVEVDREDNIVDNDGGEVIVECNECSLVIIVKTTNRK